MISFWNKVNFTYHVIHTIHNLMDRKQRAQARKIWTYANWAKGRPETTIHSKEPPWLTEHTVRINIAFLVKTLHAWDILCIFYSKGAVGYITQMKYSSNTEIREMPFQECSKLARSLELVGYWCLSQQDNNISSDRPGEIWLAAVFWVSQDILIS